MNKRLKKQCLPVITWNKNHLSNQVVAHTVKCFAVATFEGLGVTTFQTE